MKTPGERLHNKLELAYPVLVATAERLWSSPHARALYPEYLCTMHMVVRSAVPLMRAAFDQARLRAGDDPVAAQLLDYLARHMREETGHDAWLLEDLAVTGTDPKTPLVRIPSPRVATMVGAQYYWLYHHHPVSVLGHIAALESYPPPVGFAERLCALTGYPRAAFRAITRHAVLDIGHQRDFYEMLDTLSMTREHETLIGVSALHTVQAGIDVLSEIYERVVLRAA